MCKFLRTALYNKIWVGEGEETQSPEDCSNATYGMPNEEEAKEKPLSGSNFPDDVMLSVFVLRFRDQSFLQPVEMVRDSLPSENQDVGVGLVMI